MKIDELEEKEHEQVQQIIEEGMPEKKKEKKTRNVIEKKAGGAEVFLPTKKRHRKAKYPKSYKIGEVNPEPDPERWLPKWQRSKFKKMAKKRGIILKGAQGDALVDTDVTNFNKETSTVHKEVTESKSKKKRKNK